MILERLVGIMVEGFACVEKKLDYMSPFERMYDKGKLINNMSFVELLGVLQRPLIRYSEKGKIK